jgi:hypothetical protein
VAIFPAVVASRLRSFSLARAVITTLNPAAPEVPVPEYRPEFLVKALSRALLGRTEDPQQAPLAIADAAAAVVRHSEQAGREGMIASVQAEDPVNGRWARVARGGVTCAFCLLLVSRGPVYTRDTAVFQSHPKCDCIAVPASGDAWFGREQYLAASKIYAEATQGSGDKLNAFRRAVTAGDTSSELPVAA